MKVGEIVTYVEGVDPKTNRVIEFPALVLGERHIADHAGKDGEPLLTVVFIKERIDSFGNPLPLHGTGQQGELIQTRLDVAHVSHEYTDEQKLKYSRQSYDGGRWKEAATNSGFSAVSNKLSLRESEISSLRSALSKSDSELRDTKLTLVQAEKARDDHKAAALTHLNRANDAEGKLLAIELRSPQPPAQPAEGTQS